MRLRRSDVPRGQQHDGQGADGIVNSYRHLSAAGFDGLLQPRDALERIFVTGHEQCLFGQCDRIGWMRRQKLGERGFSRGMISHGVFQRQTNALQAGPPRILLVELANVIQACQRLLSLEHPLHLIELLHQVGAAEFHLLAGAAGTWGIGIDRHGNCQISRNCSLQENQLGRSKCRCYQRKTCSLDRIAAS